MPVPSQAPKSAGVALRPDWRAHLFALSGYVLLTLVMTWPLVREFTQAIPGDSFDGWQNYWNQWWIKVALVERQQNPLFTDLLYHPTGVSLLFHTLNPFNGLVTLPIQLASGLIPAYNSAVLLAWVLGGYGTFLLVRWQAAQVYGQDPSANWAAFVGGVIFTFAPFHMAHLLGHMQVLSLQWIPFYILYLLRSLSAAQHGKAWLREALLAALFLVLVGLCDWYYVLYLVLFTAIAVLWSWLTSPYRGGVRQRLGHYLRLLLPPLFIGTIFFAALSFWLIPMVRETRQFSFMVRPATDLYILSASLMDFLIPNRLHTLFRPESFGWIGNQLAPVSERTIALGYTALGLATVGAFAWRRRVSLWVVAGIFFFAMALGPVIHLGNITADDIPDAVELPLHLTPFGILAYFSDFVRLSRSVSRYAVMVQLAVAVLASLGLVALSQWGRTRAHGHRPMRAGLIALPAICLILILAEYWVAPYPMSPPDTPAWYSTPAATDVPGAVLNLPLNYDRPGYLLYQTVHQQPLTVAYISRDDPRTLTERAPVLQHFRHLGPDILVVDPVAVGPTVLSDLEVDQVVLDRYKMPGGREREYTTRLAEQIFADQSPLFEDDRLTVYAVEPPQEPHVYPVLGPLNWGALTSSEEGVLSRLLLGPAELSARHAPPGASIRLRYRSEGSVGATVSAPTVSATTVSGADEAVRLEPAATARDVLIGLPTDASGAPIKLVLQPDAPGRLWIEQVEVIVPQP